MWQTYKNWIIGAVVLVLIGVAVYSVSANLSTHGPGADEIGASLSRVEKQQRDIIDRLDKVSAGLDRGIKATEAISNRIAGAERIVDETASRIDSGKIRIESSQQRISEGQQLLQDIRQRAGQQNKQPTP